MINEIIIRREEPKDFRAVEKLTYEAFLTMPHSDGLEALLAHKLRDSAGFVAELDLVAETDGRIVGNIMYSKCRIIGNSKEWEALSMGPVSVPPALQNRGIGSLLVRSSLDIARKRGYRAVLLFGHEAYYPRFGFVEASEFKITTADGQNFSAFMALPLYPGALDGVEGKLILDSVFENLNKAEGDALNKRLAKEIIE